MNIKSKIKKLGAGIMASLCAISVISSSVIAGSISANADLTTENSAFPSADTVIAQAATLLGAPYGWGFKGYTGAYYQGSYSPLSLDYVRGQGVDCSGLLYYTLTHLGYSTSGFSWNNPVPVDTPHWLSINDSCTITCNGITSKVDVEKANIPYTERPYWECADGSTITPGSVVIADNLAGEDHSWIYMGEFGSRQEVVDYLLDIGVNASYINSNTVGDGSGDGGIHWRIESNGSQGCVINNRTDGKKAAAMNMYAFRVAQERATVGSIRINKQAEDGQKGGRTFTVTGGGQTYTLTTGDDGTAELVGIPVYDSSNFPITYTINENDVPVRYVAPAEQSSALNADDTIGITFENKLKKFKAEITKKDSENTEVQGDASLAGAVYGLYRDGERVAQYTTDENGHFVTDIYPCGSYTLQELSPSLGYQLNDEIYIIGGEPDNYSVEINPVVLDVSEDVVKGSISIIKHSDKDEDIVVNLEAGAEFEVYLTSAGSYDKAKETERDRLITDENGIAHTKDLPYGTYTVHQTKTVNDSEFVSDFDVNIIENGKTYEYILNDKPFSSHIKVTKIDAEAGKAIPFEGAGFQIFDSSGVIVDLGTDTFYTNSEGYLITPEPLAFGDYSLVEVQAPMGYVLDNTPVPFTVSAGNADEDIISITKEDTAQKGRISVNKTGEVFSSTALTDKGMYVPVFEEAGLENAVFDVIAAEDIITPDGTIRAAAGDVVDEIITDAEGYAETAPLYLGKYTVKEVIAPFGYVLSDNTKDIELVYGDQEISITDAVSCTMRNEYQKVDIRLKKRMESDELFGIGGDNAYTGVTFGLFAAENITAADGSFIPENGLIAAASPDSDMVTEFAGKLPFANYYVQETSTDGRYVLSSEEYPVNCQYMGQEIDTVTINYGSIINEIKRGSVNGIKRNEHDEPLENAVFGLFKADETDFTIENALLIAESDYNGGFSFTDIPCGEYIVTEIAAPSGYALSDDKYPISITEDGDTFEIAAENHSVSVAVSKEDIYGNEVAGAELQIIDESGNITDSWISDGESHIITNIPAGGYTLREIAAPAGYIIATDISFSIDEKGNVTVSNTEAESFTDDGIPCISMIDDATAVKISKQDITTGKELVGATLQVIDNDGNIIEEWVSENEPHFIDAQLIAGETYTLREITAPQGYTTADDIEFTVNSDGTVTEVVMKDAAVPKQVTTESSTGSGFITINPPTGDHGRNVLGLVMVIIGTAGLLYVSVSRRKKKETVSDEEDYSDICPYFIEGDNHD